MEQKLDAIVHQHYKVECVRNGEVVWVEEFDNIIVTAGRDKYLSATLKDGLASPAWYVLLKDIGTVDPADTMGSHAGWAELQNYSNAARPTWTPGSVASGSVSNSASPASFTISVADTVYGAGLCDNSVKAQTTGVLLGAGNFTTERAVEVDDTLNVTITCSIT